MTQFVLQWLMTVVANDEEGLATSQQCKEANYPIRKRTFRKIIQQ